LVASLQLGPHVRISSLVALRQPRPIRHLLLERHAFRPHDLDDAFGFPFKPPAQPLGALPTKIERVDKRIDHPSGITLINEIITYYAPEADISGGRRR
jgi:hypothetical protein